MKNKPILEACVETVEQAVQAERCGADRIELCGDLSVGGITPSNTLLRETMAAVNIPIMAMARPRGGNFVYSYHELEEIKRAIDNFKELSIKGVVFGFLKNNEVDLELTSEMASYAHPLEVTFHKAIDFTLDPIKEAKRISQIPGIQRILTSGGKTTAEEGKGVLIKMQKVVGKNLTIIAAGKVTVQNLTLLHQTIGAKEYHGRRIVF